MVYLYSEDDKGGYHLIRLLNSIYFENKFTVKRLKGIYKLGNKIKEIVNTMGTHDIAILIYDDSPGNKEVKNELDIAYEIINELEIKNIYFIAIVCMEYEVLSTYGIKTFANKNIHPIIDDLSEYRNKTELLKNHLKTNEQYKAYKNRAENQIQKKYLLRSKKLNKSIPLTEKELNKRITMDSICKVIMEDGFQNELIIDKSDNLGKCWLDQCCIRKTTICNIDHKEITDNQIDGIDKQRFLMYFSRYHKVAMKIAEITNIDTKNINEADVEKIMKFTKISKSIIPWELY